MELDDCLKRLRDMRTLEEGWMWGDGKAIDKTLLRKAGFFLLMFTLKEYPLPRIYPTLEGGIMFEWSTKDTEISMEIGHSSVELSSVLLLKGGV